MEEPFTWSANESVTLVASRARRERSAAERAELLASLSDGVARLVTGERWARYLSFQSRFHAYSANNTMLLLLQNPYATRVAGYRAWQALDRQVRSGETALRILAPVRYRREDAPDAERASEVRGFRLVSVFDVSQTGGPDLPGVVGRLEGLAPAGVFDALVGVAHGLGFRVERPATLESGANGDTSHAEGRIRVVASHAEAQQVKTLAHEIAHALLHDPTETTTRELTRGLRELEAESAAYVICAALGMDTSDYSFGYVAGWAGGGPEAVKGITASASRIQRAASAVLKSFEGERPAADDVRSESAERIAERTPTVNVASSGRKGAAEGLVTGETLSGDDGSSRRSVEAQAAHWTDSSDCGFVGDWRSGPAVGADAWRERGVEGGIVNNPFVLGGA